MFVMPVTRRSVPASAFNGAALHDLGRVVDRLFDDLGVAPRTTLRAPAIDVRETDTSYLLAADLPGVAKEDVKVSIDGHKVSIAAAVKAADAKEGERVLLGERSVTRFERSLKLPVEIDDLASSARLENGVLTLTLVKKGRPGATQLAVN